MDNKEKYNKFLEEFEVADWGDLEGKRLIRITPKTPDGSLGFSLLKIEKIMKES